MNLVHPLLLRRSRVARYEAVIFGFAGVVLLAGSVSLGFLNALLGIALMILGLSEWKVGDQFLSRPAVASARGVWNQAAVIGVAAIYCAVGILTPLPAEVRAQVIEQVAMQAPELDLSEAQLEELIRFTVKLTYIVLFALTAAVQGTIATFYARTMRLLAHLQPRE